MRIGDVEDSPPSPVPHEGHSYSLSSSPINLKPLFTESISPLNSPHDTTTTPTLTLHRSSSSARTAEPQNYDEYGLSRDAYILDEIQTNFSDDESSNASSDGDVEVEDDAGSIATKGTNDSSVTGAHYLGTDDHPMHIIGEAHPRNNTYSNRDSLHSMSVIGVLKLLRHPYLLSNLMRNVEIVRHLHEVSV